MNPEFVYLISDYGEDGAEHVHATLNRHDLLGLLSAVMAGWPSETAAEAQASLAALLAKSDADLVADSVRKDAPGSNSYDLTLGWGGVQLHVVRLSGGPGK